MGVCGPLGPQFSVLQTWRHCLKSGRRSPTEACARPAKRQIARTRERSVVLCLPLESVMMAASRGEESQGTRPGEESLDAVVGGRAFWG